MNENLPKRILYCRVGWMNEYKGAINDRPIGGGAYNKDNIGHEVYNYLDYNGNYYGYVEDRASIHIEKLGASKTDEKIDGVLVVWFAPAPNNGGQKIVGWYNDAVVYRHRQKIPAQIVAERDIKDVTEYNIFSNDVILIPSAERIPLLSKAEKMRKPGQNNVWYGNDNIHVQVLNYIRSYENHLEERLNIIENGTEKLEGESREAVVRVRINQDKFRKQLLKKHKNKCCLCGVNNPDLLVSSHIKPWRDSNKIEKLDANNGLLLCPNHDKLFDCGFISFNDDGTILISDMLSDNDKIFMNVNPRASIEVNEENITYIRYHRKHIFRRH